MPSLTIHEALLLTPDLPRLDREVLLAHVLGQDRVFLLARGETRLTLAQTKRYLTYLARAKKHEPIAYITGTREFYGHNFFVGGGVLIPRPETELLVQHLVEHIVSSLPSRNKIAVVDVGTGSGAIITSTFLSLTTKQQKNITWFAIENDDVALRYARKNTKHLGVHPAIRCIKSDLLSRVSKKLSSSNEIFVAANLPYLSHTLYRSTAPNVQRYEPKNALLSGTDGLDHYRRLLAQLRVINAAGTKINFFLEISPEQTKKLTQLFAGITTLSSLEIISDLAGKSRLVCGSLFATRE